MKTYDIEILAEPFRDSIKPRERAEEKGIHSLSDRELIALLLGTGTGGKDVMALALEVLNFIESQNFLFTKEEITKIKGMGSARSTQMMAVFEIVRRHSSGNGLKITNPETVHKILFHYTDRPKEFFFALTLNGAHELIKRHIISTGNLNRVYVHPREVFTEVIRDRAAAIMVGAADFPIYLNREISLYSVRQFQKRLNKVHNFLLLLVSPTQEYYVQSPTQ